MLWRRSVDPADLGLYAVTTGPPHNLLGVNLLVVDDEPTVRELLCAALRHSGFTVTPAATGQEALDRAHETRPDLVLLDVMLPDLDGFEVIRLLREQHRPATGHIPVVFLTARDATQDKIEGLVLGGDDYVTKPFDLQELIARIHAVLRRTSGDPTALLHVADLELDPDGVQATRAGEPLRLSPTEFRLLHYLMSNTGRTVSKPQILAQVWKYDFNGDTGIVDTYISYLRRKIDNGGPKLIHTVHGVGYVLRGPKP
ncbi:two-component system response regulator [Streptomyces davaonensis JCM 4913]|uniref:Two-component system response regulator n=1 Tax=Streptomyces davaonensis (strain DSM 101723 / JCM 4913 / KCC S-0913 / 768) TaxID=1214101 RepID=K4R825_STRDJ|nr:two-component system response regulator [Streptomyces davaonensis JCM 4913]